jgi:hypothetical protein
MDLKDSSGVRSFLQAPRMTNTDYLPGRLLRSFLRFGRQINLLRRRLINDNSISDRGSNSKPLRVLLITEKRRKRWNYLSRATIRNYIYESKRTKTHESIKSKSSPPSYGTEDSPAAVLEAEALEQILHHISSSFQ